MIKNLDRINLLLSTATFFGKSKLYVNTEKKILFTRKIIVLTDWTKKDIDILNIIYMLLLNNFF